MWSKCPEVTSPPQKAIIETCSPKRHSCLWGACHQLPPQQSDHSHLRCVQLCPHRLMANTTLEHSQQQSPATGVAIMDGRYTSVTQLSDGSAEIRKDGLTAAGLGGTRKELRESQKSHSRPQFMSLSQRQVHGIRPIKQYLLEVL